MGLLMSLSIPKAVWEDISIDFINGLPINLWKSIIVVIGDRFSKFCHFGTLKAKYSALSVAEFFVHNIIKLHGYPQSLTFDRDKVLIRFWKELNRLSETKLNLSSAYHPQTDGKTMAMNKCLEGYLRAMVHDNPR